MRASIVLTGFAVALTFAGAGRSQPSTVASGRLPDWMAGCWSQRDAPMWVEECWMAPRGGVMLGAGRSGKGDRLVEWEATQIIPGPDGKLVYWASPEGGARVAFTEVSRGPQEIVFANPAHDYPQRIRYWREGKRLDAQVSLLDGSKSITWRYRRDR